MINFVIQIFPYPFLIHPMATVLEQQETETVESLYEGVTVRKPAFDGRSYNWQNDDRISAVFEGAHVPATAEEAEELLQERFGCVYKALPEEFRRDPKLLLIAVAQSAGHEMAHAPEEMRADLDSAFYVEAIRHGARGWILQWANDAVKNDPQVAMAAVRNDGCAIRYLSPELQADEAVQLAALENNDQSARYITATSDAVASVMARLRDASQTGAD